MSSRRTVVSGLLAIAGIGVTTGCSSRRSEERPGPLLTPTTDATEQDESVYAWRGLSLALRALPESRRAELVQMLSAWLSAAETKVNPLVEDLEDHAPLMEVCAWFLPLHTSASQLLADRFRVPGRDWWVTPIRNGAVAVATRAWPAWPRPTEGLDPDRELARFAAWPISQALLVDCQSRAAAERIAEAMQSRLCEPSSCIGMFVLHAKATSRSPPEFDQIRVMAERVRKLAARAKRTIDEPLLAALLAGIPKGEPALPSDGWLDLGPTEMLVVPRLGAVARPAQFAREVRGALSHSGERARIVNFALS